MNLQLAFSGFNGTKITSLDLRANHLCNIDDAKLQLAFSEFKETNITSLNLGMNNLNLKNPHLIFSGLKETKITSVYLNNDKGIERRKLDFSYFKGTKVSFVDLSKNELHSKSGNQLQSDFSSFKETNVTFVDLSDNALG
ncbi:MAG: hypothetical protein QM652_09870 [Legionella sp.]|uniref:hypothetical protein n=1 Tax=Legionella sp. TaxID=459 RepID=UPI0039E21F02